jgi:deoxyribodipyrimidine photo-lyase
VKRTLVWFRGKDLRLADHEPLTAALVEGQPIPLFVLDPYFFTPQRARELPHRIQFLLESLRELSSRIEALGSRLLVVAGRSTDVVPALARSLSVDHVVAQRWSEPFARQRDSRVAAALSAPFTLFEGETLAPPDALRTTEGRPYSVYTPFQRAFRAQNAIAAPLPEPSRLPPLSPSLAFETTAIPSLSELGIDENPRLLSGGEVAASVRLEKFLSGPACHYDRGRNELDRAGSSRLSQDLKFGTLSPRRVWQASRAALQGAPKALSAFENELLWREFSHALLHADPALLERPFNRRFDEFPWVWQAPEWDAWVSGHTGYPVVDASARQLLEEGFVHNRARMISASFLTKHLLIHYRRGEAHYMKYLVDGDWANNNAGWQWSAGCGADGQPYFRVFNPVSQGERFDPEGGYVRRYLPELAQVPVKFIHRPWDAPAEVLAKAGVRLGTTYPRPIVEHSLARKRFLAIAESYLAARRKG